MSPFMKLFWEEQQKYLKNSSKRMRYYPMIIRYCLSLASKLAAVCDDIWYNANKGTGFVILLSSGGYMIIKIIENRSVDSIKK